jgi:hypothetical protein
MCYCLQLNVSYHFYRYVSDTLVVWNSLTSLTNVSCTYGAVLTTVKVSWFLFILRSAFGIWRAHEGCSKCPQRGFCWWRMDLCSTIAITCNVRGYWVPVQLRPTAKSYTRWYFKKHFTSSCYSAVGLVPKSNKVSVTACSSANWSALLPDQLNYTYCINAVTHIW